MSTRHPRPKAERNPGDYRSLTETLAVSRHDSGLTLDTVAEQLGVRPSYLGDATNTARAEVLQFQARHLVPFMRITGSVLPLEWMAAQLGYVLVKAEHAAQAESLSDEIHQLQMRAGDLAGCYLHAKRDGRLCLIDRADLKESARRVMREAAEIERAVEALPFQVEVRR